MTDELQKLGEAYKIQVMIFDIENERFLASVRTLTALSSQIYHKCKLEGLNPKTTWKKKKE